MGISRRSILKAVCAGVGGASAAVAYPARASADWQLRWSPAAAVHGMDAWDYVTNGRADSHPEAQPHIFTEGDNWRFEMHTVDRDNMPDRQRQEVAGCRVRDSVLNWRPGETWRLKYSMYLPSSLMATTTFTHILQIKQPRPGPPIVAQSLRRINGAQMITLHSYSADIMIGSTSLDLLHDRWADVDMRMTFDTNGGGSIRWILRTGDITLIDVTRGGIDALFHQDSVFPKWGIYRSLGDDSASLVDCYMLLTNPRAYQFV